MRSHHWMNVPGELITDVSLVLAFFSTGYHDPGCSSGPPEYCYPPEGADERTPDGVAYLDVGHGGVKLTPEQTDQLVDLLRGEIYDTVLEHRSDD